MSSAKQWRAGFAEADMTPGPGQSFMAGFGMERYAVGKRGLLMAQALCLIDKSGQIALLLCADIVAFDPTTVEYIRREMQRRHALPAEAVMLSASHTHWGPAVNYRMNFAVGAPNPWYMKRLEELMLKLADEAIANASPATVSYGSVEAQIGHNRRLMDAKTGKIRWGVNIEGTYDRHTPVMRIQRRGRPGQIVLVSHACHPTSSGGEAKWSPDYVGAMRDAIRDELGANSRGMFVMGCGGDAKVTHRDAKTGKMVFTADPVRSKAAGKKLAKMALASPNNGMQELEAKLTLSRVTGTLKFDRPFAPKRVEEMAYTVDPDFQHLMWYARQLINFPDTRKAIEYEVQAWRFGKQLTWLGLEGEVCSTLGPLARGLVNTPEAMIAAYVNRAIGYIPSKKIREEGAYEGDDSHMAYFLPAPFTPGVEEEFRSVVMKAIKRLG